MRDIPVPLDTAYPFVSVIVAPGILSNALRLVEDRSDFRTPISAWIIVVTVPMLTRIQSFSRDAAGQEYGAKRDWLIRAQYWLYVCDKKVSMSNIPFGGT
jgi:hypothetical protein